MMSQENFNPGETLHGKITQLGVPPGAERLETFQKALDLQGTPPIYSQDGLEEKKAHVKFFDPTGSWSWYATEWDRKETCFGYVTGHDSEWGYFDLRELAYFRGRMGIGIEVDEHFSPQRVVEKSEEPSKPAKDPKGMEPGE